MDILFFTYIRLLYCMYKTFILARRSRSVKFSLNYVYVPKDFARRSLLWVGENYDSNNDFHDLRMTK